MIFDLHTHSLYSDGALTPAELISLAIEKGIDGLAITDHDTLDAYTSPDIDQAGIRLVAGIELSTEWQTTGIHVLGLDVDVHGEAMKQAVHSQSASRRRRARQIGERLQRKGISNSFDGACALAPGAYVGRPHFARYLVESGHADSVSDAFRKYLGDGKAGDVRHYWAGLEQVVRWIRDANGIAVLAHPLKYKLTRTRLKRLLDAFVEAGGQGLEVSSGKQIPQQVSDMARLCEQYDLLASCGSDFHMPGRFWAELGVFNPLPAHLTPVWESFK